MIKGRAVVGKVYTYVDLLGYVWRWDDWEVTTRMNASRTNTLRRPLGYPQGDARVLLFRACPGLVFVTFAGGARYRVVDADAFDRWCAEKREEFVLGVGVGG